MTFQSGLVRSYQIISVRNGAIKGSGKNLIAKRKGVFTNYDKDTAALPWHREQHDNKDPSTLQLWFFTSARTALGCQINSILNTHTQYDTQLCNTDGMSWNNHKCFAHSLKDIEVTCCCDSSSIFLHLSLAVKRQTLLFILFCSLSSHLGEELLFDKFLVLTVGWRLSILHHPAVPRSIYSTERSTPTRKVLLSQ